MEAVNAEGNMMKTILVVAAHADDEALGCGGTLIKHQAAGDQIVIITMTDGVSSRRTNSQQNACQQRKQASEQAAKFIGAKQRFIFDLPDNAMDSVPLILIVQKIEPLIDEIKPNIIYTHHSGDLNIDHQRVHQAVMTACRPQPGLPLPKLLSFEVNSSTEWQSVTIDPPFRPNYFVDISEHIKQKQALLNIYAKEMRPTPHSRSIDAVTALARVRGTTVGVQYAEAFMLLREVN